MARATLTTIVLMLTFAQTAWAQTNCDPNVPLSSAAEYTDRGRDCVGQGGYTHEHAIADYTRALELNPNYARAYNNRAASYEQLGDLKQAVIDYTHAIEIDPAYVRAYDNRGWVYYVQNNYSAALADFEQAVQLNPDYDHAYLGRANVYAVQESYNLAYADYKLYVELMGDSAPAWVLDWIHSYETGMIGGRGQSGGRPPWMVWLIAVIVPVVALYLRLKTAGGLLGRRKARARNSRQAEMEYARQHSTPDS